MRARLQAHMRLEIVARNRALGPDDDETAFGLRLRDPGIGEGAPTRLQLRKPASIADNRDRMFVHLEALRPVDDRGHFQRRLAVHEPGPERCAIAEIVEQAAAASGLAVPPGLRLLAAHFLLRNDRLVGAMEQRAAVAVVEVHLQHFADHVIVDQSLGGDVRGIPAKRPVDGEPHPRLGDGGEDTIGVGERSGERLLEQDVDAQRGDRLDAIGVARRRGAEDRQVRPRLPYAALDIVIDSIGGNREVGDRVRHPGPVGIADACDFRVRVLVDLPQQVAHVNVFEADADDAPSPHFPPPLSSAHFERSQCKESKLAGPVLAAPMRPSNPKRSGFHRNPPSHATL